MNIDTNITKASYILKRLRDSGYRADKLIGYSDSNSLECDFNNLIDKIFPAEKPFYNGDIKEILTKFKTNIVRTTYTPPSYALHDSRAWTILINGGSDNILLTFYKNAKSLGDKYDDIGNDYFEFFDGSNLVKPIRRRLKTLSFEMICQELVDLNIEKYSDRS